MANIYYRKASKIYNNPITAIETTISEGVQSYIPSGVYNDYYNYFIFNESYPIGTTIQVETVSTWNTILQLNYWIHEIMDYQLLLTIIKL